MQESRILQIARMAVEKRGVMSQLLQAQEEAGELIVAISHLRRKRKSSKEEVVGEIADLKIMIEQLCVVFGHDVVDNMVNYKLDCIENDLRHDFDTETEATDCDSNTA